MSPGNESNSNARQMEWPNERDNGFHFFAAGPPLVAAATDPRRGSIRLWNSNGNERPTEVGVGWSAAGPVSEVWNQNHFDIR